MWVWGQIWPILTFDIYRLFSQAVPHTGCWWTEEWERVETERWWCGASSSSLTEPSSVETRRGRSRSGTERRELWSGLTWSPNGMFWLWPCLRWALQDEHQQVVRCWDVKALTLGPGWEQCDSRNLRGNRGPVPVLALHHGTAGEGVGQNQDL